MALDVDTITSRLESHALASGHFERVNLHEPKSKPGTGLTAAIWADYIGPATGSGLAATSSLVVFQERIYSNMLQEPQDAIDPEVIKAIDYLMGAYSGDFTLDGAIRNVDLLGQTGRRLEAQAGYLNQDGTLFRVMTIVLPLIVNDLWSQAP